MAQSAGLSATPNDTETYLLQRVSTGDEEAFTTLYRQHASLLYHFVHQHTDNSAAADDLVQEIFTQVWLTRETLTSIRNFRTYLFVLARNAAVNEMKKRIRQAAREREYSSSNEYSETDTAGGAGQQLSLIEAAIAALPPQQHQVWVLSRREGLRYVDIAQQMGLSRETVKKYLQHANAAIIKYVEQHIEVLLIIILAKIS